MIQLLRIMQRVGLHYCIIISYYYVIIIQGGFITHYYLFQSPELADDSLHLHALFSTWCSFCSCQPFTRLSVTPAS